MNEPQRREILELIFGRDGLCPGFSKMFLDVYHEGLTGKENDNADPYALAPGGYNHVMTTRWMCYFNSQGQRMTRERGEDLIILTTLYGPAPWMTQQKYILGRDLDPASKEELAEYMVSWVKYLHEAERLPVRYLSLHNEGDAYYRWPRDGSHPGEAHRDYNMYWPPQQVVDILKITRKMLDRHGLHQVGLTPGETQTWYRFDEWGYARALFSDADALSALALITSHSFSNSRNRTSIYYGDFRSIGMDLLRSKKPGLHAWVTSMSWGDMDVDFVDNIRRNIYLCKCNGLMPWACIQRSSQWIGGDPNPGTAIRVNEDGSYSVLPGYYFYKQVTRAGQPGMQVADVQSLDPALGAIAFAGAGTDHPDAFILINLSEEVKQTVIHVRGSATDTFHGHRTSAGELYCGIGRYTIRDSELRYSAPPRSVTTFYAQQP